VSVNLSTKENPTQLSHRKYLEIIRREMKLSEANEVVKRPRKKMEVVGLQVQNLQLPEKSHLPSKGLVRFEAREDGVR
jgi:hypothetical protein